MNRDIFIRNLTGDRIELSPKGRCANELSVEEFEKGYENFFDMIFEIAGVDISSITGYGEIDEDNKAPFATFEEFFRETFNENQEGYTDSYKDIPLIIMFEDHRFRSFCGEEYLCFLRREKKNAHWAFVFVSNKEYNYYLNNFGKQFQRGK